MTGLTTPHKVGGQDDEVPLAAVASEMAKAFGIVPPPGAYRRLQALAQDGRIEVTRRGGRIFASRRTFPAIGHALGIALPIRGDAPAAQQPAAA